MTVWTDDKRVFETWESFRDDFYYPEIVGRAWNGVPCTKRRYRDQTAEQKIHDLWRLKMGTNAPWTDIMIFYDNRKAIAVGEIKFGYERKWGDANREAAENVADRLRVPLLLMRFISPDGPIEVSVYPVKTDAT